MLHLDGKYLYELMMLEYLFFFLAFFHWESLKPLITQWNHLIQIGTWTHAAGDSNSHNQDLNLAEILLRTWTHVAGTQTQLEPVVPGFRT